ncbi:MAG TPA: hypothetical protein VHB21_05095 [Minicystis sp.]|nr:hypothetical protein [Minicystis sp.]
MEGSAFDEDAFFRALAASGARVLLIGRRALIALGAPVLTADYDLWVHPDDVPLLNAALEPLDLAPSHTTDEARRRGRYVLENDEHVAVLVARSQTTKDGAPVRFDDVWSRRRLERYDEATAIAVPCIDDLILTKRWSLRQKDVIDIQILEALRDRGVDR